MQLAGAGSPKKCLVLVFIRLNLANLKAVAIVIKKPVKDEGEKLKLMFNKSENICFSVNPDLTSNLYITKPGTTPLVTKSEKESSSFPNALSFFSKRAKKPSA
tara:strand:- start:631 stop:939 length:309 start_codon:yes stop_codon:yes gene_type:complete